MKTTLFFWNPISRRLRAIGAELKLMWIVMVKFERAKSQQVLLPCFWYDYYHIRRVQPDWTIEYFLDLRVEELKRVVANLKKSARKRQLIKDLLDALCDTTARGIILDYLKGPSPDNYEAAVEAIRSLWRRDERAVMGERGGMSVTRDSDPPEEEDGRAVGVSEEVVTRHAPDDSSNGPVREEKVKPLFAKTYIIAVQLWHEKEGKISELESLFRRLPRLKCFIREKFNVDKLPARLEDFRDFSYRPILEQKNGAKKGQLRPPLRQIAQHPEIFGKRVAAMAQEILDDKFD